MVGTVLTGFEVLRGFQHCRTKDRVGRRDVRELVACACARACLVVWLSVCVVLLNDSLYCFLQNCFEKDFLIHFKLANGVLVWLCKGA